MPCEACNTQFTVFKRKKSCTECRRLYCSNCLIKSKERILCERCVIFTTRPLSKIELLKLKAKDLIFYLQSKHISTTGCVEKEELVNLVLIHVNNYSPDSQSSRANYDADDRSNPFDQIKNTCQNLFSTFTEKIAQDLNFDLKPSPSGQQQNIFAQQPRRSSNSRNNAPNFFPSFPSNQTQSTYQNQRSPPSSEHVQPSAMPPRDHSNRHDANRLSPGNPTSPGQNSINSPTSSSASGSGQSKDSTTTSVRAGPGGKINNSTVNQTHNGLNEISNGESGSRNYGSRDIPRNRLVDKKKRLQVDHLVELSGSGSGCECSDDEIITNFQTRYKDKSAASSSATTKCDEQEAGPSGSASSSTKTGPSSEEPNKAGLSGDDSSDVSSFEDLGGAVGGGPGQCSTTSIEADSWQCVTQIPFAASSTTANVNELKPPEIKCTPVPNDEHSWQNQCNSAFHAHSSGETDTFSQMEAGPKTKANRKISRRRSDGIVYTSSSGSAHHNILDYDEDFNIIDDLDTDLDDSSAREKICRKRSRKSCHKCGKTKGDLRKHIERFRKQLETTTNASEVEIKQQLEEFLNFLESRSRNSIDDGIGEADADNCDADSAQAQANDIADSITDAVTYGDDDDDDVYGFDDDTGIHVYGSNDDNLSTHPPRQFININDYETSEALEELSVKQLKEILMLNRIDFKGCCEKSELLERVQRLWNDLNTCPAVEKLPTDDLCKICMDAPIECVLLECGHMATCTSCGKVLSECPICRQYIVRVVRFFKA